MNRSGRGRLRVAMVVPSLNDNNLARTHPYILALQDDPDLDLSLVGVDHGRGLFPLLEDVRCAIHRLPPDPVGRATGLSERLREADDKRWKRLRVVCRTVTSRADRTLQDTQEIDVEKKP